MEQTVKKKFGIRDIMTIAAMMVITYLVAMVIGSVTLPFPVVYLYGSAGIDAFIGALSEQPLAEQCTEDGKNRSNGNTQKHQCRRSHHRELHIFS